MGGITFGARVLPDTLTELAGYKAGLALSLEALLDHVSGSRYVDAVRQSEEYAVRLRAEEYEELFYYLLHRIGHTETVFNGDITGAYRVHKYKKIGKLAEYEEVMKGIIQEWRKEMERAMKAGEKSLNPEGMMVRAFKEHGEFGLKVVMEQLDVMERARTLSPHSFGRSIEWKSSLPLTSLFNGSKKAPEGGKFIDQRFIDYLHANQEKLGAIHWREFEKLTAEFYEREGYKVDLGPGSGDGGVDVRVWNDSDVNDTPLCIVQCKRQKDKVEQVIVKGLYADVQNEKAQYGVLVTTSELAPSAKAVIATRGYPIEEVNKNKLGEWLTKLRTPGSGIVRN